MDDSEEKDIQPSLEAAPSCPNPMNTAHIIYPSSRERRTLPFVCVRLRGLALTEDNSSSDFSMDWEGLISDGSSDAFPNEESRTLGSMLFSSSSALAVDFMVPMNGGGVLPSVFGEAWEMGEISPLKPSLPSRVISRFTKSVGSSSSGENCTLLWLPLDLRLLTVLPGVAENRRFFADKTLEPVGDFKIEKAGKAGLAAASISDCRGAFSKSDGG
eukprot:CAMPEP_0168731256 /NCGR_PEP_ID=MMETSP0724-20121128/7156_1 /TAXON_ID=265536 /ORGANISM="Amphiprora sp., Strain CCMP467" /LENGTH=214 /DNA_ID=CAMNT_0008778227 /DNA_START=184 /DNA_END=828 /DNA_ORIENTATION=+